MKRLIILLLVSLANLFGQPAFAQIDRVNLGDRVRIQAPIITSDQMEGTITDISSDHFRLALDTSEIDIPWRSINYMEIRHRKRNIGKGVLIGASTGALTLGITAAATNSPPENICNENPGLFCDGFLEFSDGEAFAIGAVAGILIGGTVGALIGTFVRTDRWKRIPMEISLAPTPSKLDKINLNPTVSLRLSLRYKN